ncbi:MAG: hypothetical protein H7281_05305 [Bacteriovorax sp.]|nr:hypothetical protein [Bacteriovorax sp.]
MKKIICVATILSMTTPTIQAAGIPKYNASVPEMSRVSNSSNLSLFSKKVEYQSCSTVVDFAALSQRSEGNITGIFDNVVCSNVGSFISSEKLDKNYCTAALKCQKFEADQKDETLLDKRDKEFIAIESMNFLMQENIKKEMGEYANRKADHLRDLLAYAEKLPPKFVKYRCESAQKPAGECLVNSEWDHIVKGHITGQYFSDVARRSAIPHDASVTDMSQVLERPKQATIDEIFSKIQVGEVKDRKLSKIMNNPEAGQDGLLDNIMTELLSKDSLAISKMSHDDLQKVVLSNILKLNADENRKIDPIFAFRNLTANHELENAMKGIFFSPNDFIVNTDRSALSDKVNMIRLNLVNKYIEQNCGQVATLAHVCSNVAKSLENGHVYDILLENKDDIFRKMIANYESGKDPDRSEKIKTLNRMANAKNQIYQKYLAYMMEVNSCQQKFKDLQIPENSTIGQSVKHSQMLTDMSNRADASSQALRDEKGREVEANIKKDVTLQRELRDAGVKLNPEVFKPEVIGRDTSLTNALAQNKTEAQVISTRSDDLITAPKSIFPDPGLNNHPSKGFDPSMIEVMNNATIIEDKKNRDADTTESSLRARMAELETKEKSLSKKMQTNPDGVKDGKDELDELQSLRQQIEDLKNTQARATKDKMTAAPETSKESERSNSVIASKNNGSSNFGNNSSTIAKNDENNRGAVAASANAGQAVDYSSGTNTGANAASRSIASANSSTPGDKVKIGSDKIGPGIMLSKTGEVVIDPTNIPENPKEGDIVNFIEESKGQPFLIRENGVLMKVTVELDTKGKPQLANNGKPRFKKVRLSKAQEEIIVKEASNVQKSMKEVGRDPTRLFKLKSLINDAVQRN